jgi:hypothetical protein
MPEKNLSERLYHRVADAITGFPRRFRELALHTQVEILIGAALVGTLAGGIRYQHEREKQGHIPVSFSESGEIIRAFKRSNLDVPPLTQFYTSTNEICMKVFEASNLAHTVHALMRDFNKDFARELEYKMDPSWRVHTQIPEHVERLEKNMADTFRSLQKLTEAEKKLDPITDALRQSWDDDHDDIYETETYTVTEKDENGVEKTVEKTRQVYVHTIHTYDYDAKAGTLANALLQDFIKAYPDLKISEQLAQVTTTGADNEYAMKTSMLELNNQMPSAEVAIQKANMWRTGSNFTLHTPVIEQKHLSLKELAPEWQKALKTSKSTRYTTYSSNDSGPKEFQIAKAALGYAVTIMGNIRGITNGIHHTHKNAPILEQKIREFIDVELHNKPGNANKLKKEIMQTARDMYSANFRGGFDTQPAKWEMVVVFTVLGMIAGAGLGFGVDQLVDHAVSKGKRDGFSNYRR